MKTKVWSVLIAITIVSLLSALVLAAPTGPDKITRGKSERGGGENASALGQQAEAGNMTSLNINASATTKRWQGYYGNITGTITLDDTSNNTLYNWILANPQGEVYASNGSGVSWNNIDCINKTANASGTYQERYNITHLNRFIGIDPDNYTEAAAGDSFNATFNQTFGDDGSTLVVGTRTFINADNCSMVTLNVNQGYQTTDFQEVVLTDNVSIIFAAILENDATGFSGSTLDFEMIVGVNGTSATAATHIRNYYFFVELT